MCCYSEDKYGCGCIFIGSKSSRCDEINQEKEIKKNHRYPIRSSNPRCHAARERIFYGSNCFICSMREYKENKILALVPKIILKLYDDPKGNLGAERRMFKRLRADERMVKRLSAEVAELSELRRYVYDSRNGHERNDRTKLWLKELMHAGMGLVDFKEDAMRLMVQYNDNLEVAEDDRPDAQTTPVSIALVDTTPSQR